jgi:hypothetical protein
VGVETKARQEAGKLPHPSHGTKGVIPSISLELRRQFGVRLLFAGLVVAALRIIATSATLCHYFTKIIRLETNNPLPVAPLLAPQLVIETRRPPHLYH